MAASDDVLEDPVFGTLKDRSTGLCLFWERKYPSRRFRSIRLSVESDGGISDAQREAFKLFVSNEDAIFADAQEYLFETYKRCMEALENDPFQGPEDFAQLTQSREVWGQLDRPFEGGTSLHVLYSREHTVFLSLGWNCTWDVEHGASVCIEDGKVVDRERWLELQ